jgi:hypothetical protein
MIRPYSVLGFYEYYTMGWDAVESGRYLPMLPNTVSYVFTKTTNISNIRDVFFLYKNPILFAICTSTFSKCCKCKQGI